MASCVRTTIEQYREIRYDAIALWLMPMNRTDKLGDTSPGSPGWNNPITPCFFSPVRSSRMSVVSPLTASLLDGTSGIPRQVTNGDPNMVTVGGGTPRRVHSRPKAAIARG